MVEAPTSMSRGDSLGVDRPGTTAFLLQFTGAEAVCRQSITEIRFRDRGAGGRPSGRNTCCRRLPGVVSMKPTHLISLGCFAAMTVLAGTAAAEDAYDDAFARAAALEQEGRLDDAARALEMVLPLYPQDFALPLQIGWIYFRAGRYEAAQRHYWIALERSPRAVEGLLGLAASLERQGRCEQALAVYGRVLEGQPDHAEARAGIARCTPKPAWRTTLSISASGGYFPDAPSKWLAGGGALGAAFAHRSGFVFGATYRYLRFAPPSNASASAWDQHEAFASLGYSDKLGAFSVHYGFLHDGSGVLGNSHHLGMFARFSPFGDIELRATASLYDDLKVFRVEPSWRIPIAFGLSIRPGVAVQYAGEVLATGMGTLSWDYERVSLWAGGKYGDEARPFYLSVPAVYAITEKIAYGAWAGASVNVSDDVRIHLTYAMDRLKPSSGNETNAHALTLGVTVSF